MKILRLQAGDVPESVSVNRTPQYSGCDPSRSASRGVPFRELSVGRSKYRGSELIEYLVKMVRKTRQASDARVGTYRIGADAWEIECPPPSGGSIYEERTQTAMESELQKVYKSADHAEISTFGRLQHVKHVKHTSNTAQ